VENPVQIVILAGGQGTRFWPLSRSSQPKQFLSLGETGESLIAATARRVTPLCDGAAPLIVSNTRYRDLIHKHVPGAQILCEPVARNTAPSIGLAALMLEKRQPGTVMVVLPADHAVSDEEKLLVTLRNAIALARDEELLVTVGVEPTYAHTGYGYIKRGAKLAHSGFMVSRFYEKPNFERATQYLQSGGYYWNSGMFVWRSDTILAAFKEDLPEMYAGLQTIGAALGTAAEERVLNEVFPTLEAISVDFGILEHARNCAVVAAEKFGWNDVGSWDAWAEHFEKDAAGNLSRGEAILMDCHNCVVHSEKRLTAVLGAEDLVIIDSGDAVLVTPRTRVQDVRAVVEELRRLGKDNLV
jgi:mannose-1-phosphate guanylyltransferase